MTEKHFQISQVTQSNNQPTNDPRFFRELNAYQLRISHGLNAYESFPGFAL